MRATPIDLAMDPRPYTLNTARCEGILMILSALSSKYAWKQLTMVRIRNKTRRGSIRNEMVGILIKTHDKLSGYCFAKSKNINFNVCDFT